MIKIEDCLGKKVLVKERMTYSYPDYYEMDVLELSPNGQYIKVRFCSGRKEWRLLSDFGEGWWKYEIVDILGETRKKHHFK